MAEPLESAKQIEIGDFYEDAFFHPCLCMGKDETMVWGISLVDGSYPRTVDFGMTDVLILTAEEAIRWKFKGPDDKSRISENAKWW